MDFGYARVSTKQAKGRKAQHVDDPVERLVAEMGIDRENVFTDDGVSRSQGIAPGVGRRLLGPSCARATVSRSRP